MKRHAPFVSFILLIAFLSASLTPLAIGQVPNQTPSVAKPRTSFPEQAAFDEFAAKQMASDKTPGLTIGFLQGDFEWVKGYGYSDLENKVSAKADSAYRLASVSKSMTAVAIMQLVEKGKINLDSEVQTYVSYFPKKQWPVTVRQVLGHIGGISHIKEKKSTREAIAIFENFDLIAEPGTKYSYSSYGYNLLAAIVESASGMSFGDYMRQNVWLPAGMNNTRLDDPLEIIPNRVRGYQLVNGQVRNSEFVDISSRMGGGGTRSTVPDLLKYARAVMGNKLLSPASNAIAVTSMATKDGRLTNYGMGWETSPYLGRFMLIHSGGQQETSTLLYVVPSQNLAMAVAINYESSNPGAYLDRLFQLVTGSPRNVAIYAPDKSKAALVEAMNLTFNYGLAYYDRMKKPVTTDEKELTEAFAYFNSIAGADFATKLPEAQKKIRDGVHPVGNEALTKVGSYMASRLAPGNWLASYNWTGPFSFFRDYITFTEPKTSIPVAFHFSNSFEKTVSDLADDWSKTNSEYVRTLWLMPDTDLKVVGKNLRESFSGASIYPNLTDPLFNLLRNAVLSRNHARALEVGQLSYDLYPELASSNFSLGLALVLNNENARGEEFLKKAAALNPTGLASGNGLNNVAYQLHTAGYMDDAFVVIQTAIKLYPQEANLHDTFGEFQLKQGNKAKALEAYKKALELDPNFPNATAAREIVKKLETELGGKDE
jgi:CubicO group peptidase (beta-lactamase class C family)